MEELEEDEEVVIEGSELHKVLLDMGYTDFESTSLNKKEIAEDYSPTRDSCEWKDRLNEFFKRIYPLKRIFASPKVNYVSSEQLATILKVESLLDDHGAMVQSILNKNSYSFWSKVGEWSTLIASAAMLGVSCLMPERRKTTAMMMASSIAAIGLRRKYDDFHAVRVLRDVVCLQNDLYHLYKKALRVLRKGYQLRTDWKQEQSKFSNVEIDRLKYLQPVTEALLNSIESVSCVYHRTTSMLVKLLPKAALCDNAVPSSENEAVATDGEITYSTLRHLYYIYILAQSETMQLLAFAYDPDTWTGEGDIPHAQLTRINCNLRRSLRLHKTRLVRVIEKYENCKAKPIQRKYRGPAVSKWRDLYLNLDLLSRKVQTAYDAIGTILEEIDGCDDLTATDDEFIAGLSPRINDVYKQIDTARNFAEFNNLLMAMLQRTRRRDESPVTEETSLRPEVEHDLPIVRDSDPQIIDEVFEEYITEEYLKPMYDENDEAGVESSKLDKLLAKNFMSELKEALIDKYKSMSEREAKALLRKYRETNGDAIVENEANSTVRWDCEEPTIPRPPPLPGILRDNYEPRIIAPTRQTSKFRPPVPLPRANAKARYRESVSPECVAERFSIPTPAHLPSQINITEKPERISIDQPTRKIPAFVTFEEEFIGSGENSAEELEDSDCEEDRGYVEDEKLINESEATK